ncbi:hypothetical protein Leryth_018146 [Lithospermum erythrorhizon]|nr:hypothetical protein Leryth_018146 [Lithospermum erythrorhizon]
MFQLKLQLIRNDLVASTNYRHVFYRVGSLNVLGTKCQCKQHGRHGSNLKQMGSVLLVVLS